jgi:hypothetical protein
VTSAAVGRACGAAACWRERPRGRADAAQNHRSTGTGPPYLPSIGYCWQVAENRGAAELGGTVPTQATGQRKHDVDVFFFGALP